MRAAMNLFGERSLTLVAALFDNGTAAARAAGSLQRQQRGERCPVLVVEPNDPRLGRKLEPESTGIWHTLLRSHGRLGLVGTVAGAIAGAVLVAAGWDAAASSPAMTIVIAAVYGLFCGAAAGRPADAAARPQPRDPQCARRHRARALGGGGASTVRRRSGSCARRLGA